MGYTTSFDGEFRIEPKLKPEHQAFLLRFSESRRMKRRAEVTALRPDPVREAAGLPVGYEGAFFVGATGVLGQESTPDILDAEAPPHDQPGLWCQWIPTDDGAGIRWNEMEKFYEYEKWLRYLIRNFLKPWGYTLSGSVDFQGEELEDYGKISVERNMVFLEHQAGPPNLRLRAEVESDDEEDED